MSSPRIDPSGPITPGRILAVVVAAILTALGGLLVGSVSSPSDTATPTTSVPAAELPITPVGVDIPSIGASSTLLGLGRTADGKWAVPDVHFPEQASWFSEGVTPGQPGNAVILGHVSGTRLGATTPEPGVFARLHELAPGAEVSVRSADGRVVVFVVDRVEGTPKRQFPTDDVLTDGGPPGLVLVTCGGQFDRKARSYKDSVIVYATAKPVT